MKWNSFIAAFIALLLSSCLDCREEVWLNPDGSGRIDISYTLPAAVAKLQGGEEGIRNMLGKALVANDVIKSPRYEVITLGDRLTIRVRAAFHSALDLKRATGGAEMGKLPSSAANLAGKVEAKLSGRSIAFKRTITAGAALPGAFFMPPSSFKGHQLTYIIHLPIAAKHSNATHTEDSGRSLIWEIPLDKAIQKPVTTEFVAEIPVPKWFIPAAVGSSIFILIFMIYIWRRLRQRKANLNGD